MPHHFEGTTILCVRHRGKVAMAGDGQVTLNKSVMKHGAHKVRRLYQGKILSGFAGSAADAFALFTRFEDDDFDVSGQFSAQGPEVGVSIRF